MEYRFKPKADGKSMPVNICKPLTKTNPFLKLNKNLILECIEFNSPMERLRFKFINRKFKSIINIHLKILLEENKQSLNGFDNMDVSYLKLSLPQNFLFPLEMKTVLTTKDQGWASASYSTSWVELQFFKDNLQENSIHKLTLVENYKEKTFKTVKNVFNFKTQNSEENKKLLRSFVPGGVISMNARSQFPGWKCYMNEALIELKYIAIDN